MQLRKAIRQVSILSGIELQDAAASLGITQQACSSRIGRNHLTDSTYDVLDALGYKVCLVPKDCNPPKSVEVER